MARRLLSFGSRERAMKRRMFTLAAGSMLLLAGALQNAADAQQRSNLPPVEGSQSGAVPPCPTVPDQAAAAGAKNAEGGPAADARPVESNVILPSAGGSKSAAPTAQQQGEAMRAGIDCPMAPNHPNAMKPADAGKQGLPEFAK
jgi:hypothetical protein